MTESDVAEKPADLVPPHAGYPELFASAAALVGESIAAVSAEGALTYRELDLRSDTLAAALVERVGYGAEPVTIMCGHGIRALVALLAVIKSGRPASLLDTTTPAARMRQVATQAGPIATLFDAPYAASAAEIGEVLGVLVSVDAQASSAIPPPRPSFDADRPICIVFTSGSTGIPKGVILGNRAMCDALAATETIGSGLGQRLGIPQPLSFIGGLGSVLRALFIGSAMYLYDPRRQGIEGMVDWVVENQLTTLGLTPHGMRSLAAAANARGIVFDSLTTVLTGGEAVLVSDIVAMRRCTSEDCIIVNASGSSEVWGISYLSIGRNYELPESGHVPAGTAFGSRVIYLEDDSGSKITEPGVTGMIIVAGGNMSDGYWRNPELTAQRFFTNDEGVRIYRTGDLGRWNARGELEYAGRSDHMLKVRGYLVEPAEIESHLSAKGELKETVVVGRPGRDDLVRLVAYVVPEPSAWVSAAALRRRLAVELPDYMVPTVFVELDELPRNPNGKIDRLTLPEPPARAVIPEHEVWNSVELAVGGICAAALGVADLGRNEDLFELGADSLAVVEILAGVEEECGIVLGSAGLMDAPTVATIAAQPRRPTRLVRGVLVPLRTGGSEHPLFCVAGAAGLGIAFRSLARHLPEGRPVYGLQAYGLEGGGLADLSVEAAARRYTAAIREVQPHGPYHIIGHSLGGLVAFEMARSLVAKGEKVALLGLIDTFSADGELAPERLERLQPLGAEKIERDVYSGRNSALRLRQYIFDHRPYLLRRYWVGRRENRYVLYWTLGVKMAERYSHSFAGDVVDLPASIYQAEENAKQTTHWQRYVAKPPVVHDVAGDHMSMLREPFVNQLAGAIATDLGDIDRVPTLA